MKVQNGSNVRVHYRGTLADGTEFDNSRVRGRTLDFTVGVPRMIPGFSDACIGMVEGETKAVTIPKEEAYGDHNPAAYQTVPKSAFGENFPFEVGGTVQGNGPQGRFFATISAVNEEDIVLDMNHPLAGEDLTFEIELVEIQAETTEEEVTPVQWDRSMKKAQLLELAKQQGLPVNTRSTKAQILEALQTA
tara:strand:- start:696 stop:1268 length:573 start_codon:yes stop_codon:yes gene_type:complete